MVYYLLLVTHQNAILQNETFQYCLLTDVSTAHSDISIDALCTL